MASFTTRVELHGASSEDYDNLHAAMAQEGFSRFIRSGEGHWYQLPTAEYDRVAEMTAGQVSESAKRAANSTGKKSSVLVSQSSIRAWEDLAPASPPKIGIRGNP